MEDLRETQSKSDMQLLESRAYVDKSEREHQKEVDKLQSEMERQLRIHSDLIGKEIITYGGTRGIEENFLNFTRYDGEKLN